jgi:hypothetical protein
MQMKTAFVLATTLATTGLAYSAHAATVDKQKSKGSQAAASFSANNAITCADGSAGTVFSSGFLSGSDSLSKETGTPKTVSNGIFVEIDIYSNTCTGVNFNFGDGSIPNGYTPPNKKLNSAGLEGSTTVQDFDTGTMIPVVLDLVIEGTGPLTAEKAHSKTRTVQGKHGPITITTTTSADSSRTGVVSGTLSVDGVELDATFSPVTLSSNGSTEITIQK